MLTPKYKNSPHFINFWNSGNGKELADWSKAALTFKRFEEFAPLYYKVDEIGDEAVKETFLQMPFHQAMNLIEEASRNGITEKDEVPENFKKLFLHTQKKPDWLNPRLLQLGSELCQKASLNSLMILRDYSLMGGYDFAYLNKPLIHTGALKKGAVKRLSDTLEFWVNATRENALEIHDKGYEFCIKIRLIHSYSRLMILKNVKNWDHKNWGQPINSWDMMATYLGFSLVFLHGLKKLGVNFSEQEETGLFHLWKYVGYLIGIPENVLPENKKQATEQFYLWTAIQPPSDEDSVLLAKSLLDENLESTIFKYQFQRKNLRYLHVCMNWYILDKEVNQRLKIPKVIFSRFFPKVVLFQNYLFQQLNSREKQIEIGAREQEKVLGDYLRTTPRKYSH